MEGNLVPEVYTNNSVANIWNSIVDNTNVSIIMNGFFEVSQTGSKVNLVFFNNEIPNKPIPIG